VTRSVPLGKQRYKVRVVKNAQQHAARKDDELAHHGELRGYIDWEHREIVIELDTPERMASALLHEMFHGAFRFLDEDVITAGEEMLFPILWRGGWRPF